VALALTAVLMLVTVLMAVAAPVVAVIRSPVWSVRMLVGGEMNPRLGSRPAFV
jgi:hypothetical protein